MISTLFFFVGSIVPLQADRVDMKRCSLESFDLLIIAPSAFSEELQPLVDHKNTIGMDTALMTLEHIRTLPETSVGRDDAEKMKYFIKYAIETYDISYVLLVGGKIGQRDTWYLPVRYVQMDNGWEPNYITDLYFADIYDMHGVFSSWDSDNDGIFGEWIEANTPIDTGIDLYPDISIGRLPCRSEREVTIVVNKIITYETTTYLQNWFNNMVAIAGDTYPESDNPLWVGYEGEIYADLALGHMDQFNPVRLFLSKGSLNGSQDVIDAFHAGCGFVYFVGHGNPRTWGNHPPNDHEFVNGLQNNEMSQLDNLNKYPVCIVSGCHNCQFDVGLTDILHGIREQGIEYFMAPGGKFWRSEWTPECWGWRMTREKDGGSIVTYGATALGHTKEDKSSFAGGINELEVEMFRQYGQLGVNHAGDILKHAISWYLDTYPIDWTASDEVTLRDTWVDVQVAQSYILFGDPSLLIGGYET
jgi:hypothetical protein